jgi:signal peptidase II
MSNVTDEQSPEAQSFAHKSEQAGPTHPKYVFFAVVSAAVLIADVASKAWAVTALGVGPGQQRNISVIKDTLAFVLAYNKGGAWGLFHGAADAFRKPFFMIVSVLAVLFIVSLYRKVHRGQWALTWGLPLVLGGALGNLVDRVIRVGVVDFIDYRAGWVESMNNMVAHVSKGWTVTDHWPTFNVADIAICVGVGLMAIDVLFSKRHHGHTHSELPEQHPSHSESR